MFVSGRLFPFYFVMPLTGFFSFSISFAMQVYEQARAESLKVPSADALQFSKRKGFDQKNFTGGHNLTPVACVSFSSSAEA
jgi:hypothetical protein